MIREPWIVVVPAAPVKIKSVWLDLKQKNVVGANEPATDGGCGVKQDGRIYDGWM